MIWSLENAERTNVPPLSSFRLNWGIVKTPIKHLLLYVSHHGDFFSCPVSETHRRGYSLIDNHHQNWYLHWKNCPHLLLLWHLKYVGFAIRFYTGDNGHQDPKSGRLSSMEPQTSEKPDRGSNPSTFFPKLNNEIWLYICFNSLFRTRYNNLIEVTFDWNIKQRSFQGKKENNLYGNFCHNPQLLFHNTYW